MCLDDVNRNLPDLNLNVFLLLAGQRYKHYSCPSSLDGSGEPDTLPPSPLDIVQGEEWTRR